MALKALLATLIIIATSAASVLPGGDAPLLQGEALTSLSHEDVDRAAAHAVIAHIDSGINPYHEAFRDNGPLANVHPSAYIPGYPVDAPALHLTLDAPTVAKGLEEDADQWAKVEPGTLYWVPGTRIIGAISFGGGGTNCPAASEAPPASILPRNCTDTPILDDHGHGTMTATRMAGAGHSLAPHARIVSVEGLGGHSVRWAADQGWIDVQTNSWLSFAPPPANSATGDTTDAFRFASTRTLTVAASGNGAAYTQGGAPTPTYALSTAAPGVVLVGAHDNGRVAPWSGAPAHVVADGYGGWRASNTVNDDYQPHPMACCTSAAAPYAAGAAAAIVQEARELLGDTRTGVRDGVVAKGSPGVIRVGPLADGALNLTELRGVLMKTAEERPLEGRDDGLLHWMAQGDGDPDEHADRWGPGANPFCQGCVTLPTRWGEVPADAPAHHDIGYGAVNERTLVDALAVIQGHMTMPDRSTVDAWFANDQAIRAVVMDDVPNVDAPVAAE